ncbi:rCG37685 [Rattus norvegicus]|uniref:RCG37685 n=1 Tax=Rattus norvegicus TaxID=10116 RepID=A6JF26_RAT|nr:rCG37685 [Rattus norvegicus]
MDTLTRTFPSKHGPFSLEKSLKAYVGSHGCIPQVSLGSYGVCKCPGMSQDNLLPPEGSDLGCAGSWRTSGSYSCGPSHCGNFHQRSLGFVFQLENSL